MLFRAFGWRARLAGVFQLIYIAAQVSSPFCIKGLLEFLGDVEVEGAKQRTTAEGVGFAVGLGALALLSSQAFLLTYYLMQNLGMEARAAVMNAVYHRCLSVTTAEAGHTALGRSTNLMSVDAEKLYLVQQCEELGHSPPLPSSARCLVFGTPPPFVQ